MADPPPAPAFRIALRPSLLRLVPAVASVGLAVFTPLFVVAFWDEPMQIPVAVLVMLPLCLLAAVLTQAFARSLYAYDVTPSGVRHRYLHPTLGRWLSRDPAGFQDTLSLYLYALANPADLLDAYGLSSEEEGSRDWCDRQLASWIRLAQACEKLKAELAEFQEQNADRINALRDELAAVQENLNLVMNPQKTRRALQGCGDAVESGRRLERMASEKRFEARLRTEMAVLQLASPPKSLLGLVVGTLFGGIRLCGSPRRLERSRNTRDDHRRA
jgi:RHS repeat-associated protein